MNLSDGIDRHWQGQGSESRRWLPSSSRARAPAQGATDGFAGRAPRWRGQLFCL